MVKNPGTTSRADQLRPLNRPRPVTVQVDCGVPVALIDGAATHRIERVQDRWHVDDEWWREPIRRRYYRVALDTGAIRTLYHDQVADSWFEQRY